MSELVVKGRDKTYDKEPRNVYMVAGFHAGEKGACPFLSKKNNFALNIETYRNNNYNALWATFSFSKPQRMWPAPLFVCFYFFLFLQRRPANLHWDSMVLPCYWTPRKNASRLPVSFRYCRL